MNAFNSLPTIYGDSKPTICMAKFILMSEGIYGKKE